MSKSQIYLMILIAASTTVEYTAKLGLSLRFKPELEPDPGCLAEEVIRALPV